LKASGKPIDTEKIDLYNADGITEARSTPGISTGEHREQGRGAMLRFASNLGHTGKGAHK
jgi:hypothetical protein